MTLFERMKRSIANMKGEVVLTRELLKLGEKSNVARCIRKCLENGILYKIGFGVYAKAEILSSGYIVPRCASLRTLACQAMDKLGIEYELGELERDYNNGSTQIPARVSFDVFDQKITRKIYLAPHKPVRWEHKLKKGRHRNDHAI